MNALRAIGAELVGLFVEDWLFALAIALWLAVVAAGATFAVGPPGARGIVLFVGLATIFTSSVARAARRPRGRDNRTAQP
jgi:hypothetical protein